MAGFGPLFQQAVGVVVRLRTNVAVSPSARVRWTALRGTRGGNLRIGRDSIVNCRVAFDGAGGTVSIGSRCYVGASTLVCRSSITIEDDVIISWGVTVVDHDSHSPLWSHRRNDVADWMKGTKNWEHVAVQPVHIEARVWIGFGASILKGVRIGAGSVIGAGSMVTRSVPPNSVVAGNPARVIREIERTA